MAASVVERLPVDLDNFCILKSAESSFLSLAGGPSLPAEASEVDDDELEDEGASDDEPASLLAPVTHNREDKTIKRSRIAGPPYPCSCGPSEEKAVRRRRQLAVRACWQCPWRPVAATPRGGGGRATGAPSLARAHACTAK